jgi:hypothetical protein
LFSWIICDSGILVEYLPRRFRKKAQGPDTELPFFQPLPQPPEVLTTALDDEVSRATDWWKPNGAGTKDKVVGNEAQRDKQALERIYKPLSSENKRKSLLILPRAIYFGYLR